MQVPTWHAGPRDTLVGALARAVGDHPDRRFLDFAGVSFTYAEVDRESDRLARGLHAHGVGAGDTVVALLDNEPDAIFTWFAVSKLGGVYVPLNTALKGEFLRHQIADAGARVAVVEPEYEARIDALDEHLPELEVTLVRGTSLEDARVDGGRFVGPPVRPEDLALLIYTAGTTGPSKGCMVSHNYLCNLARQGIETSGRRPEELNWTPLPLFHLNAAGASIVGSLLLGGACSVASRFSLSAFWGEIERTGARTANVLGSMIPLIAQMDDTPEMLRCKGQLRIVRGAPFPPHLEQVWRYRFGVEITGTPGFGLSEAALITSLPRGVQGPPGTSGRLNDDFDVRIFDDDDRETAPGDVGEIVCRPRRPNVMFEGYWRRPEATAAVLSNCWFHTGDLGRFDDEGFLVFVDRKKDYLRRRGENISSFEMESAYLHHEAISEVAVHSVLSELTEDDVKVSAVLTPGSALTADELFEWSLDRVPYFALPRFIEFRAELPKNAVGRVLKHRLRDEGVTAGTWDREAAGVTFERR